MWHKLKLLWKYMEGNKLLYMGAVISIGISTIFTLVNPLVIRVTIDSIIGEEAIQGPLWVHGLIENLGGRSLLMHNLWIAALALVLLNIMNGFFLYAKGKWSAQASEDIARNLREALFNHLQHLSYDYHVKVETGELIQRCTSDVETIRRFLAVQLVEVGRTVFMLGFALFIMLSLDVSLTLVSIIVVPIIFISALIFFMKVQKAFQLSDEAEGRLSTVLQENLTGIRVVRAFGRQAFEAEKFEKSNAEYRDLTYDLIRLLAGYWSLSDLLTMLQIGAVVVVGAYWASIGRITLGTLVVFTTYETMLLWPIRQMGRILTDMGKTLVSIGRIEEIFQHPMEDMDTDGQKPKIEGDIVFENVSFSYDGESPVLKNISFHAEKGKTVAILGATGSGKSSLVHLLLRLYDYQRGSITIDGVELKQIHKKWLRKNIGIVLQEPFLFSKTIKENIGLSKAEAKEKEIILAARAAAIHEGILEFEKGYDTAVGERGVTLSGGQKQRIAIARSLVQDSPVLIFDDSLSAVDTETEEMIRKALKERNKNRTTFIISHRITTVADADMILVLQHGEIVQSGTHEELIQKPGLYQRIWAIQNLLEEEILEEKAISESDIIVSS
ncbi:ATP-binding cassette, subfamily B [Geosporobacter subterraneus DSM 17957]|uniref:ATP-binding cassette, subfamily B n=1 Tax=Geosporobacter subterraneus DSM 17957 TaxID=1121919 RepID=A0A1M6FSA7_9FIRM|nr:ABC transporter ATP-binding protein [Geosporobacter subterraneus]SHJ00585.1 ATP-binding cassette, subfamily B [Geosporobacter subterraneus DSM 17957]